MQCLQLSVDSPLLKEQYQTIAKLIYETDPYIYPALFGSGEQGPKNASLLLPEVFERGLDPMFSRENLFVVKKEEQILGLILWHKGKLNWDPSSLLEVAAEKSLPLNPEKVMLVKKEYVDACYLNLPPEETDRIFLINVCIDANARGAGIGGFLLEHFLKEHPEIPMELAVLKRNMPAIRLYQKYGFTVTREEYGFSETSEKPRCYTMNFRISS